MSENNETSVHPIFSIVVVHTFEADMLRLTLKGLKRASVRIPFEVIVVDNRPSAGFADTLKAVYPEARYFANAKNLGFGSAMNVGIRQALGKYVLIFNPDIIVKEGSLEALVAFMDAHPDVGIVGPRLVNPDGSLQHSSYRLPTWLLPVYRRTPIGKLGFAKSVIDRYFRTDEPHDKTMDVDAMIGAALFCRRDVLVRVGMFDERYFLYYEDNDLCRAVWEAGYRVVYYPKAEFMHYHRRATADGGLLAQVTSKGTWIQMQSFFKYMKKFAKKENPRLAYLQEHGPINQDA